MKALRIIAALVAFVVFHVAYVPFVFLVAIAHFPWAEVTFQDPADVFMRWFDAWNRVWRRTLRFILR